MIDKIIGLLLGIVGILICVLGIIKEIGEMHKHIKTRNQPKPM